MAKDQPQKLESKISLAQLPSSWSSTTFGDVFTYIQRGKSPKYVEESDLPVINQKSVRWNRIELEHLKYIHPDQWGEWLPIRFVRNEDILWNSTGTGTIGRANLFSQGSELPQCVADSHVTILRASEALEPAFGFYFIMSPFVQKAIKEMQSGSTNQVELGKSVIESSCFPLAPKSEQTRVVSKVDELFSRIDAGEANLKRVQALVKQYRQSVLKAAVTGELTREWREKNNDRITETGEDLLKRILTARREAWETTELENLRAKGKEPKNDKWKEKYKEPIAPDTTDLPDLPEGWVWASLDQLSWESTYGTSKKCAYGASGEAVLRIPNIRAGRIVLADIKHCMTMLGLRDDELVGVGDLLIVRTNGSPEILGLGAVQLTESSSRFYFASYLIRFRLVDVSRLLGRWVNTYWQSAIVRQFIADNAATSAGQYNISQSKLQRLPVALPPPNEIGEICTKYDKEASTLNILESDCGDQLGLLGALRQSVLKDAFSGKLVPQDPNDEPASELLARITEEMGG